MFGQWASEDVWASNHIQRDTEMDDYDAETRPALAGACRPRASRKVRVRTDFFVTDSSQSARVLVVLYITLRSLRATSHSLPNRALSSRLQ